MIPTDLQEGLKQRLEQVFSNQFFKNPENDNAPLNIFKQHLPERPEDDYSLFPYVIIQLVEGEQADENAEQHVKVLFIIGAYDPDRNNQGYQHVTMIIQKMIESFKKAPLINQKFELKYPLKWAVYNEEDVAPFYFGGVETLWAVPSHSREDVEALI
jgi:hypothetical protein